MVWPPSTRASSIPVTVTVCAVSQFALVKVKVEADTVVSPVSAEVMDKTTSDDGWAPKTAVNVVVVPDSLTVAVVVDRVNAGVSLSEVGVGTGVGTAVGVATGVGEPDGRVINAVIDHSLSRAKMVAVIALTLLTPLIITVDPATTGKAVTVMVEPCSYSPNSSGARLKTNMPFRMPKTVCPGSSGVPFTDNCIPWALGVGTIVGVGIGDGVNVGYGV